MGESDLNERHLWHGTDEKSVKSIVIGGFDHRVGLKNGRIWGNGCYFSTHADYALCYSSSSFGGRMQQFLSTQYAMQGGKNKMPSHLKHRELHDEVI